jgi:hypothetical protein
MRVVTTKLSRRWIVHDRHDARPWPDELRREIVSAFRRGSMDAARCLGTYRLQGERSMLPPEAVIYLATRVVAERVPEANEWRDRCVHPWTREILRDHGEGRLAELAEADTEGFEGLVEAGRRFFFPGP